MKSLYTKVTIREKPLRNGQISLYLDYYPPIRNPRTGRSTRREFLGLYIYANPKEKFEEDFNFSMMRKAELIKCKRTEAIINDELGFIDKGRGKEDFLEYFRSKMKNCSNFKNWNTTYHHFERYCRGTCTFDDLTIDFCQGFLDYQMAIKSSKSNKNIKAATANNNLDRLRSVVRQAYQDGRIKEDIASRLQHAKEEHSQREYLTLEEVKKLAVTPCEKPIMRTAALFTCLTGLRISDVTRLKWENIQRAIDGGWCMQITIKKTRTPATLPLSEEALEFCGERGEGTVFPDLMKGNFRQHLSNWIKAAGITKHITWHCFRHTYATLQLAAGTDIYTISKMLTHSNVSTTQVYADVVSDLKRKAAEKISLK